MHSLAALAVGLHLHGYGSHHRGNTAVGLDKDQASSAGPAGKAVKCGHGGAAVGLGWPLSTW